MEFSLPIDKRLCECGCGTIIPKITKWRKRKRFVYGHNRRGKWKRIIHKNGYISITCMEHPRRRAGRYVFEHILVMEQYLGRHVTIDEVVHHINGNRSDNRIENLELMLRSEHSKMHRDRQLARAA